MLFRSDLGIAFSATSFIYLVRSTTRLSTSVFRLLSLFLCKSSKEARGPFFLSLYRGFPLLVLLVLEPLLLVLVLRLILLEK